MGGSGTGERGGLLIVREDLVSVGGHLGSAAALPHIESLHFYVDCVSIRIGLVTRVGAEDSAVIPTPPTHDPRSLPQRRPPKANSFQ